jgi:hypothetical protein
MIGYGLPRIKDLINPDCVDIQNYGLKSSISRGPKYGSIKNSFRNSRAKRDTRRIWKKKERAAHGRDLRQREMETVE